MKRIVLSLLFLAGFDSLPAQEAFYIYRNDGDFNGFFFDQVERMGYSKFDLDSVEHTEYVVQEVQTPDSLYRIPLAAIDSVGFQQPEIIFNPNLQVLDDSELKDYYVSHNYNTNGDVAITFKTELPDRLFPEVGTVLVGLDEEFFNNKDVPCAGKVREVRRTQWYVLMLLDPLTDIGDVFEQFIAVEQIGVDDEGNVRHRMSALNPDGSLRGMPQRRLNGNWDATLFSYNGRFQLDNEWFKNQAGWLNITGTVGFDFGIAVRAQFVYQITGLFKKRFYVKGILSEDITLGLNGQLAVEGKGEWPYCPFGANWLQAIKFPAVFPILEIQPTPEAFLRVSGSLNFGLALGPAQFGATQTITFDTEDPYYISFKWGNRDKQAKGWSLFNDETSGHWLTANTVLNGYVQAGLKQQIGLQTNSWIKDAFHAYTGMDIYAGPKLEGQLNLAEINSGDGWVDGYNKLKSSNITFSLVSFDREAKGKYSVLRKPYKEYTFFTDTYKLGTMSWFLFPEFNESQVSYDADTYKLKATVYPRRQICLPGGVDIGVGVYDKDGNLQLASWKPGKAYSFTNNYLEYAAELDLSGLPPGEYSVVPIVGAFTKTFPVKDLAKKVKVNAYVKFAQEKVFMAARQEYVDVDIISNVMSADAFGPYVNHAYSTDYASLYSAEVIEDSQTHKLKVRVRSKRPANDDWLYLKGGLRIYIEGYPYASAVVDFFHEAEGTIPIDKGYLLAIQADLLRYSYDGKTQSSYKNSQITPEYLDYSRHGYVHLLNELGGREGFTLKSERQGKVVTLTGRGDVYTKGEERESGGKKGFPSSKVEADLKVIIIDDAENDTAYVQSLSFYMKEERHKEFSGSYSSWPEDPDPLNDVNEYTIELQNVPCGRFGGWTSYTYWDLNPTQGHYFGRGDGEPVTEDMLVKCEQKCDGHVMLTKDSPANPYIFLQFPTNFFQSFQSN